MLTVIQWALGLILSGVALVALVLFGAAVIAVFEQQTLPTAIVGALIAFVLGFILVASAVGAWSLITAALGW